MPAEIAQTLLYDGTMYARPCDGERNVESTPAVIPVGTNTTLILSFRATSTFASALPETLAAASSFRFSIWEPQGRTLLYATREAALDTEAGTVAVATAGSWTEQMKEALGLARFRVFAAELIAYDAPEDAEPSFVVSFPITIGNRMSIGAATSPIDPMFQETDPVAMAALEEFSEDIDAALAEERDRATNAESAIQSALAAEITRASEAESRIESSIATQVSASIKAETERAENAEEALATTINEATKLTDTTGMWTVEPDNLNGRPVVFTTFNDIDEDSYFGAYGLFYADESNRSSKTYINDDDGPIWLRPDTEEISIYTSHGKVRATRQHGYILGSQRDLPIASANEVANLQNKVIAHDSAIENAEDNLKRVDINASEAYSMAVDSFSKIEELREALTADADTRVNALAEKHNDLAAYTGYHTVDDGYVESKGQLTKTTAFIKVPFGSLYKLEIDFQFLSLDRSGGSRLFGQYRTGSGTIGFYYTASGSYRFESGTGAMSAQSTLKTAPDTNRHTIVVKGWSHSVDFYTDGKLVESSATAAPNGSITDEEWPTTNLCVFSTGVTGGANAAFNSDARIYSIKCYKGDRLVRWLIPTISPSNVDYAAFVDILTGEISDLYGDAIQNAHITKHVGSSIIGRVMANVISASSSRQWIYSHNRKINEHSDRILAIETHLGIADDACLAPDTRILMADGTSKALSDVRVGDCVATPCGPDEVSRVSAGRGEAVDIWRFERGYIVRTIGRHRFWNAEVGEPLYLEAWKIGERAVLRDGSRVALVSHRRVKKPSPHATLFTRKYNLYYANGMIAGNRHSVKEGIAL